MVIFDGLKSIGKVLQEAGKIEEYKQILNVQKELLEMQNKIFELETKIRELEEKLRIKEALMYDKAKNSYWTKEGDGPFCSRCWDVEKNILRLKPDINPAFARCPECKNDFKIDPNYIIPSQFKNKPNSYI